MKLKEIINYLWIYGSIVYYITWAKPGASPAVSCVKDPSRHLRRKLIASSECLAMFIVLQ